jgi:hypothetical protein
MIDGVRGARPLDLRYPFDILDLQVTAAFENFQRVFFVGEAQPLGFFDAKRDDAGRWVFPGRAMRRLPVKVISNSVVAPFRRVLLVERRTAIVAGGRGVCLIRRPGRRTPDVDLRHCELAPGKGNDIRAGCGALVGKRHFRWRTESEAVAGTEFVAFAAIDEDERARQHPEDLADVCVG